MGFTGKAKCRKTRSRNNDELLQKLFFVYSDLKTLQPAKMIQLKDENFAVDIKLF